MGKRQRLGQSEVARELRALTLIFADLWTGPDSNRPGRMARAGLMLTIDR